MTFLFFPPYLKQLCVEVSRDGLHQENGPLCRVGSGPDLAEVAVDGGHGSLDGLQTVGCMELINGEVLHERAVVIHFVLRLFQT